MVMSFGLASDSMDAKKLETGAGSRHHICIVIIASKWAVFPAGLLCDQALPPHLKLERFMVTVVFSKS